MTERDFARSFLQDQKHIWTSPFRLRENDARWLLPAAAILGESLHRDTYTFSRLKFSDQGTMSQTLSDAGVLALGGAVAGTYVLSRLRGNEHGREAGILGAEAFANATVVNYALKYALRRERPDVPGSRGDFFVSGGDSFPSGHAIYAWSLATVMAHEYPGILTKLAAYGLATGVSVARVTGRKHFPSDVLVGSALGYGIGRMVYRNHHNADLPGANIGTFVREPDGRNRNVPSITEPLDSWAYPALERLVAMGYVNSAFLGMKPWTRREFLRLISEADFEMANTDHEIPSSALGLLRDLKRHFASDREFEEGPYQPRIRLEQVYVRALGIAGRPLSDGFHFGQTVRNDLGRPFQQGFNAIAGTAVSMSNGIVSGYVRAEYQHAPAGPVYPLAAQNELRVLDHLPATVDPLGRAAAVDRVNVLEAYVALAYADWQLTIGKQIFDWGPGESGSMSLSKNTDGIVGVKVARIVPGVLPLFLKYLGPIRGELFMGQLNGHHYVQTATGFFGPELHPQPFIHAEKLTFAPTKNFEFGVSYSTIFGGPGFPITARTFLRSFGFSNTIPGLPNDPGDRRAGLTFRYRVPGLRDRVTLYNDSMTEDEISPLGYPRRSAHAPGVYISRLPWVERADLRIEGFYTDLPGLRQTGSYFANSRFLSGFTNNGFLLGHPVGRDGTGVQASTRIWLPREANVQLLYRAQKVNPKFVHLGGDQDDAMVSATVPLRSGFTLDGSVQWERWRFPLLQPRPQTNVTTVFQLTFRPGANPKP